MKITIDQDFLKNFGDNTLVGYIATNAGEDKEIELVFPQTTRQWKIENGGPDLWLIYEHVMSCWTSDIIWLVKNGFNVRVSRL